MDNVIEIQNVTKKYGNTIALDNISITINEGDITGFLGTNGAGKSTLMNIITGYFYMTEGTVKVYGYNILDHPEQVKKLIGYLPEIPPLYMDMSVAAYLKFVCKLKSIPKKQISNEIKEKMSIMNISHMKNRLIRNLSKGYKQRVGLAQAMIGDPKILILDEPTVGLDPMEMIEIRKTIKEISKKSTIILSSHILSEVSALCNKIMIMDKGKHVITGTPDELVNKINNSNKLLIRIKGDSEAASKYISTIEGISMIEHLGELEVGTTDLVIHSNIENDIRESVSFVLAHHNFPLLMMKNYDVTLEETFIKLTANKRGVS